MEFLASQPWQLDIQRVVFDREKVLRDGRQGGVEALEEGFGSIGYPLETLHNLRRGSGSAAKGDEQQKRLGAKDRWEEEDAVIRSDPL